MKTLLSKEDRRKIKLIKKYAKIRFKRFWNEWGISKKEAVDFLGAISIFAGILALYIIGCAFY